ncbi:MAG: LamG domain-containing protein, partial [Cyclobacteriaceae bacterium]
CIGDLTFTGVDNNWFNSANWCGGVIPDIAEPQTDDIIISAGTINLAAVNALGEFELTDADLIILPGATLNLNFAGTGMSLAGSARIINYGTLNIVRNVTLNDNSDIVNYGELNVTSQLNFAGANGFVVPAGSILRTSGAIIGSLTIELGATHAPGASPGCNNITGDYVNAGTLEVEIDGLTPCTGYDQLTATGNADITGAILNMILGFAPSGNQEFLIIDAAGTLTGSFASDNLPVDWSIAYNYPNTGEVSLIYTAPPVQNALTFDGVDDRVDFTRTQVIGGLTYEAWISTTSTASTSSYAGNSAMTIIGDTNNEVGFTFGITDGFIEMHHFNGSWTSVTGNTKVNDGAWHHVAVTHQQGSGFVTLYVDGEEDQTGTISWDSNPDYHAFNRIGSSYSVGAVDGEFFDGQIDEVRIWNSVRFESTIRQDMFRELTGSESGLLAYYNFNHTSGNLIDQTINGNDGTLIGGPTYDPSGAFRPFALSAENANANGFRARWQQIQNADGMTIEWSTDNFSSVAGSVTLGASDASEQSYFVNASLSPTTRTQYRLQYTDGTFTSDYSNEIEFFPGAGNALDFDGTDDQVLIEDVQLSNSFTIETWFKTSQSTGYLLVLNEANNSSNTFSMLQINGGNARLVLRDPPNNSGGTTLQSAGTYNDGNWHHMAGVYDGGSTLTLYVDGVQVDQNTSLSAGSAYLTDLSIGRNLANGVNILTGQIDEVRIWNTARDQSDIQQDLYRTIN